MTLLFENLKSWHRCIVGTELIPERLSRDLHFSMGHDGIRLTNRDLLECITQGVSEKWDRVGWACREQICTYIEPDLKPTDFMHFVAGASLLSIAVQKHQCEWQGSVDVIIEVTQLNLDKGNAAFKEEFFNFIFGGDCI